MPCRAIRSHRVVTARGTGPATVHIEDGKIVAIDDARPSGTMDAGDLVVMPGVVDTHVHVNDPGRDWEGWESATRAAAAGGITAIMDMPLNSDPVTTTLDALRAKALAAEGRSFVDYGFWGGLVPGNLRELPRMAEAGVPGFKCFLTDSGIPDFPPVREEDLREAVWVLPGLLLVHAELNVPPPRRTDRYIEYESSRPVECEARAVEFVARLGVRAHIVHLSSAAAWRPGLSFETCPHYLTFAAEEIPDGATEFKCAPPIRTSEHREALWAALDAGRICMIVSDHSPCPPAMKRGDLSEAWGGVSSLQVSLPAVWTEAARRGYPVERIAEWMCAAPARECGWGARKGRIEVGYDADIVVWDPEATFRVGRLFHRHPQTPYAGRELRGVVRQTFVRGELVFDRGEIVSPPGGQ